MARERQPDLVLMDDRAGVAAAPSHRWLASLHELMLSTVLASAKVFADDTTLPVLDPGRGRTKTGRL